MQYISNPNHVDETIKHLISNSYFFYKYTHRLTARNAVYMNNTTSRKINNIVHWKRAANSKRLLKCCQYKDKNRQYAE